MNAQLMKTLQLRPVAFHPALARVAGGAAAGLFLSQLFYWSDKSSLPGGWIYKNAGGWHEETCLTQDEQKTARKKLRSAGLIEESSLRDLGVNKFSTTKAYRINFERLHDVGARLKLTSCAR